MADLRDPLNEKITASRSSRSQDQIGGASIFLPEQAWMIDQADMDIVDQENDSVILNNEGERHGFL